MRAGDTGYQVTELQQSLQKLGYYTGAVTGVYDNATVSAVKAFQKKNNLTVDGTAGAKLQEALDILLVPTPVPVLPVEAATAVPAITADNVVTLRRGTRGLAVTRLQERLVALGYYSITPDGIYDSDDIEAVRQFQKKNGLTADGVAGLKTQTLLYSAEALGALATPAPAATAVPATEIRANTDTTLRIGDSGTDVNLLQARLTTLNYFKDTIDGQYGTKTAEAVAAFQKANGLDADGVAGPKTLKAVYKDSAKAAATPAPAASGSASGTAAQPAISSSTVLKIGDTGTNVRSLQNMLISLGYLTGAADGIFGTKTSLAVQAFQKANKLTVDGVAGGETLSRLQTASARKNAQTGTSQTGTAVSSSSAVQTSTVFKAPSASEVRFADWYNEIRAQVKLMPDAIIYDYTTGLYYNVHMFSFGKHCDAEPVTASDTSTMYNIMGIDNWTAHAVWVILSDGKVYMASTHSHGHEVDNNSGNNLEGHICIHFPREMTAEEKESMPYAVSHQNEILRGWEETQSLIR